MEISATVKLDDSTPQTHSTTIPAEKALWFLGKTQTVLRRLDRHERFHNKGLTGRFPHQAESWVVPLLRKHNVLHQTEVECLHNALSYLHEAAIERRMPVDDFDNVDEVADYKIMLDSVVTVLAFSMRHPHPSVTIKSSILVQAA